MNFEGTGSYAFSRISCNGINKKGKIEKRCDGIEQNAFSFSETWIAQGEGMEAIMEEFSAEYFKKLAHDIMFDLNDEEVSELQEEFKVLLQQIELLDGIDTEGVEEMIYPFEAETTFLREDSVDNVISQEAALLNVKSAKAGHVHVPKVVK